MGLAQERGLDNIRFIGGQPRERIPALVSAADVCLVMLKKSDVFKTVIPTKLLEYMACERPVIIAVDGEARSMVETARAGVFVPPEDAHALAQTIRAVAQSAEERRRMGINGRKYILAGLSRESTAHAYIAVLEQLLGTAESRSSAAAA